MTQPPPSEPLAGRAGFTLIELLVVISIIALLISILLPTLKSARRAAKVSTCLSNVKQQVLGMTITATESDGVYRPLPNVVSDFPWVLVRWEGANAEKTLGAIVNDECGGNGSILWCPFQLDRPEIWGLNGLSPLFPASFHWNSGQDFYSIGYCRMGGWDPPGSLSWFNSGLSIPEPVMSMDDRGSNDAIVFDRMRVINASGTGAALENAHSENPPVLANDYQENSVGYADGHGELHRHQLRIQRGGPLPIDPDDWNGHWVVFTSFPEYLLY